MGPRSAATVCRSWSSSWVLCVARAAELGQPLVGVGDRLGQRVELLLGVLEASHDLELVVLEAGDPPLQRLELALHPLEVLGVGDQPLGHPVLVARAPGLDLFDVGVDLGLLGGEVVDRDLRVPPLAVELGTGGRERGDLGELGERLALVAQQVGARVELLEVQQGKLGGGVGFQRSSPVWLVHGSVHSVLTLVSTVSPASASRHLRGHHRQPGPLGRPVRDVDERRSTLLEELARRMVAQVAGHVDVGVGAPHRVEQEVARSPAHGHPADHPAGIAAHPDAVRRRGQRAGHLPREASERGLLDRADPAAAGLPPYRDRRARRRRTPAPRRGAPPASPRRPGAGPRAASTHSIRTSSTTSSAPTSPMVGLAPWSGRNRPSPGVENDALS